MNDPSLHRRPGGLPLLVLVGPTGVGKTEVGLHLARHFSAEIISADSRQVYRHLDIGTAKPPGRWIQASNESLFVVNGVIHHGVDNVAPTEVYSAGRFVKESTSIILDRSRRGIPLMVVGGTGLYIRGLVRGLAPLPQASSVLRAEWAGRAKEKGRAWLHAELARVDPESASRIPSNNIQRVIRGLEVHQLTGRKLSDIQRDETIRPPWECVWFGLRMGPAEHQKKLGLRCRAMEEGIVRETKFLMAQGVSRSSACFQSLGYREAISHLNGELTGDEFSSALARATRLYAKRQMTWFRGEPMLTWVDVDANSSPEETAAKIAGLFRRSL